MGSPTEPGGRDVTASIRGREPRCVGSNPTGRPRFPADAEHRRAQRAVTASPLAVVVRLHPSALDPTAREEAFRTCAVHIDMDPARGHSPPRPRSRPHEDRAVPRLARGGPRGAAGAPDTRGRGSLRPGRPPPDHRGPHRGSRAHRGGGSRFLTTTTGGGAAAAPAVITDGHLRGARGTMGQYQESARAPRVVW